MDALLLNPSRRLLSYSAPASVGLFINIVEHMFGGSMHDMDLLSELIVLLRKFRAQNSYQAACLHQMQAFVQNLGQLASIAIAQET